MKIYKSIIIIFILSISYSQDHFDELNKYLNEVDLSNTNRVLEFQMRLLKNQDNSKNYDYTNKIYKTLYDEDLRKLMGNAVDALVPKWWWFEPDKEDTLDVINELEEYHKDYPNDFILNIIIGELYFKIGHFGKAKPFFLKASISAPKYEFIDHYLSQNTFHYLAEIHLLNDEIENAFYFIEKSFIHGYFHIEHLRICPYLRKIHQVSTYSKRYKKLLNKYQLNYNEAMDFVSFVESIPSPIEPILANNYFPDLPNFGDSTMPGGPILSLTDEEMNLWVNKLDEKGKQFENSGSLHWASVCYTRADVLRPSQNKGTKPFNYINNNVDKVISIYDTLGRYLSATQICFDYSKTIDKKDIEKRIKYLELAFDYAKKSGDIIKIRFIAKELASLYKDYNVDKTINYLNVALYISTEMRDTANMVIDYASFFYEGGSKYVGHGDKALQLYDRNNIFPTESNSSRRRFMGDLAFGYIDNLEYKKASSLVDRIHFECFAFKACWPIDSMEIAILYTQLSYRSPDMIDKLTVTQFIESFEKTHGEDPTDYEILRSIYSTSFLNDPKKAELYTIKLDSVFNKSEDHWLNQEKVQREAWSSSDFDKLISLNENNSGSVGHLDLGVAWAYLMNPEKAKEHFSKAILEDKDRLVDVLRGYEGLAKIAILQEQTSDLNSILSKTIDIIDVSTYKDIDSHTNTLTKLSLPLKDRYISWYDLSIKHDFIQGNYLDLYSTLISYRTFWLKRNILLKSLEISSLTQDERNSFPTYQPEKKQVFVGFDIISESSDDHSFTIQKELIDKYSPEKINKLYLKDNLLSIYVEDPNQRLNKGYDEIKEWTQFHLISTDSAFAEYEGIQNALKIYRKQLSTNDPNATILASKFYQILIKPIESIISNYDDMIIIPDHNFTYLPFETLLDGDKKPLVTDYTISYIHSNVILDHMAQAGHDRKVYDSDLLAFGGAIYDETSSANLKYRVDEHVIGDQTNEFIYREKYSDLPFSKNEVHNISSLFDKSKVYTGLQAGEPNLMELSYSGILQKYKYIHFATHGKIDLDQPEKSAIVLSLRDPSDYQGDGFITVEEINELDLNGNIVTLSACQTKAGKKYGTEGAIGLNEAFLSAGARGVCSTLWKIADKPTSLFMQRLYAKISEGTDYRSALSQTKRDFLIGNYGKSYSSPSIWAPFVYYGM